MLVYWLEQSGAPPGDEWLSPEERHTLAQFRFPKRRSDWRLGRWTAKRALAARLGVPPTFAALSEIEVRAASSGAPRAYRCGRRLDLAISISHSHGRAFCALAGGGAALGCDVERIERRSAAFAADYFTPAEQALVLAAGAGLHDSTLTLLWSAKESVLKALECGLRADLLSVEAAPGAGRECEGWLPLTASHGGATLTGWSRQADGFVWTVIMAPQPSAPVALYSSTEPIALVRGSTIFDPAR